MYDAEAGWGSLVDLESLFVEVERVEYGVESRIDYCSRVSLISTRKRTLHTVYRRVRLHDCKMRL